MISGRRAFARNILPTIVSSPSPAVLGAPRPRVAAQSRLPPDTAHGKANAARNTAKYGAPPDRRPCCRSAKSVSSDAIMGVRRWSTASGSGRRCMRSTVATTAILILAALAPGCSWIFVRPLWRSTGPPYDCTSVPIAPAVDTIFVITNTGSVLYVLGQDNVANKGTAVMLGLAVATLWGLSAGYGYSHTNECWAALAETNEPEPEPQ